MDEIFQIEDILRLILSLINDGTTYKTARLVCHRWYDTIGDRIDDLSNHLWTLVLKYPSRKWHNKFLMSNDNTTIGIIEKYFTFNKSKDRLYDIDNNWILINRHLSIDFIESHMDQ